MRVIEYRQGRQHIDLPPCALALGLFDGVHLGHRELIRQTVKAAREAGLVPGVFTFRSECSGLKEGTARLYSTEEKLRLIESEGAELAVVADFSDLSELRAEVFARRILAKELNCRLAASGTGFRFGRGAEGDVGLLVNIFNELNLRVLTVEDRLYLSEPISTTRIRRSLAMGQTEDAATMLTIPYHIMGRVERGLGLGHSFGFPTVNVAVSKDIPLAPGVYRTVLPIGDKLYTGVTNLGVCPTFGERELHAETMICDFSGDLYGAELTIYFLGLIRAERPFGSAGALREQIYDDAREAKKRNGDLKWLEAGLKLL